MPPWWSDATKWRDVMTRVPGACCYYLIMTKTTTRTAEPIRPESKDRLNININ